jgi:hypothetical protein
MSVWQISRCCVDLFRSERTFACAVASAARFSSGSLGVLRRPSLSGVAERSDFRPSLAAGGGDSVIGLGDGCGVPGTASGAPRSGLNCFCNCFSGLTFFAGPDLGLGGENDAEDTDGSSMASVAESVAWIEISGNGSSKPVDAVPASESGVVVEADPASVLVVANVPDAVSAGSFSMTGESRDMSESEPDSTLCFLTYCNWREDGPCR